ncbi:hypothetical protein RHMOL_Rhmol04G0174900 [Rhododendron molle]|uniref:Uncharacterized protein n=1 Tax=Rhododendron molle TaxID=49168 RepID=A0ACC0P3X0_RHOML|nr:hypothetical protein RHMOL_Rhmol04G0174900 [Rhododendron molle]
MIYRSAHISQIYIFESYVNCVISMRTVHFFIRTVFENCVFSMRTVYESGVFLLLL